MVGNLVHKDKLYTFGMCGNYKLGCTTMNVKHLGVGAFNTTRWKKEQDIYQPKALLDPKLSKTEVLLIF
jgi:hypothetical protein